MVGYTGSYGWTELGNFGEVMSFTQCENHPWIFRSYLGDALDSAGVTRFMACRRGSDDCHIYGFTDEDHLADLYASGLMLLPISSGITTRRARVVDPQWVDKNLIRRWKRCCDKENHEACQKGPVSTQSLPVRPGWLVDTWRLCLVPGSTGAAYVALSYVWGKEPFFKSTRQNVDQLQMDSALSDAHQRLGVPRTIADAIVAVGLLGERYLWVDALCVVQDDDIARHSEINKMASIFAGASITIVASEGEDANYGLRGLRGISQPRNRPQDIFRPAKGYHIVHTRQHPKGHSIWSKRGWTYQEGLLSRRHLIFGYNDIRWQCACSSFFEDVEPNPGSALRERSLWTSYDNIFSTPFPSLRRYTYLIRDYNERDFTHPEDALSAFTGITTALGRTFYGGFLCGLPLMFLDVALCWQPADDCKRRKPSNNSHPTQIGLPSWSWVGWKCKPGSEAWENGCDYVKSSETLLGSLSGQQTLPIVDWSSRKWGTNETRPLNAQRTTQELKTTHLGGKRGLVLPSGWTQFDFSLRSKRRWSENLDCWNALGKPRHFYRHDKDPECEFWYPIPMVDDTKENLLPIQDDTLLCGRTRRAFLYLGENIDSQYLTHSIRDGQGGWAGTLVLNQESSNPYEFAKASSHPQENKTCELVVISAGYAIEGYSASGIEEWDMVERPRLPEGKMYEYYNVLWVSWQDGVAYRNGCGRVIKSVWEVQDFEWIDLILG